jgi:MarR family transcriptional regulator, organic hydroperoxide resistance regulator
MKKRSPTVSRPELLSNGSDTGFRSLIHDIIAYSGRIQEIRSSFGSAIGLTGSEYTVLISIAHLEADSGVGINAVAEHLHLSGAFVTSETNKLVSEKLVDKRNDDEDRRRVRLRVTAEGRRRLNKLSKIQAPVNDVLFATLTHAEFLQLSNFMARLVNNSSEALALLQFHMKRDLKD